MQAGATEITRDVAADAVQKKAIVYDRQGDAHYDVISAFIKSIRGSDPDGALFWLARMIEAGEDPRFIARRLIVHASEDIGLADSVALVVAIAAAQAVEHVGLPEARLNLAHATIYLATAPEVQQRAHRDLAGDGGRTRGRAGAVAPARRQLPGGQAARSRQGLSLPHDFPGHAVEQEYRPTTFQGQRYYEPSGQGRDVPRSPGTGQRRGADRGSGRAGGIGPQDG